MNNELFDPGIDNLPMPVDGIEPDLEMLTAREQLMKDIDSIVENYYFDYGRWQFDHDDCVELTRLLCDAVCRNFPTN